MGWRIDKRRKGDIMIDKKLVALVPESRKPIAINVFLQWLSLVFNILTMREIALLSAKALEGEADIFAVQRAILFVALSIVVRGILSLGVARTAFSAQDFVKRKLRFLITKKLLSIKGSYTSKANTSEAVQLATEGVEQLETYFSGYLPQLFFAMLAPITLFFVISPISLSTAVLLLVFVPLIPISIALVQTFAKKLLDNYWGQYTTLGDSFLENLQGLTTLKIYQADKRKAEEMEVEAENFRIATMKVLVMQLNSISVMDIVAFGGAAAGMISAILALRSGSIFLNQFIWIVLLSADFFLPMRALGSFFHVAMSGRAASDKIFKLLACEENREEGGFMPYEDIKIDNLSFSYNEDREILSEISLSIPKGSMVSIVGESGSGKSTLAKILSGELRDYNGSIKAGEIELSEVSQRELYSHIMYVGFQSTVFRGTVRDNLRMAKSDASDEEMWKVLERTKLSDFLKSEDGLDTKLNERGNNFSGGQKQRLALARALLSDADYFIFDEASSNIDIESEEAIWATVFSMKGKKTMILISHRLSPLVSSDKLFVFSHGKLIEQGSHKELLENGKVYSKMWRVQEGLENFVKEGLK